LTEENPGAEMTDSWWVDFAWLSQHASIFVPRACNLERSGHQLAKNADDDEI
jgi:hypothetical protein